MDNPAPLIQFKKYRYSVPGHVWFVAYQVAYFKNVTVLEVLQANRDAVREVYKIPEKSPSSNKSDFKCESSRTTHPNDRNQAG